MKKSKRVLAMILAVVMAVSVASVSVFATNDSSVDYTDGGNYLDNHRFYFGNNENAKDYKIVTLGDSTSIGYALSDYGAVARSYNDNWFSCAGILDNSSKEGTPYIFGQYVQDTLGDNYNVTVTNLGLEGMRYEEIHAILDSSFTGDTFTKSHMESYTTEYTREHGIGDIHEIYAQEIADADCILIDSCTNSFGTYLANRLTASAADHAAGKYNETYLDVADELVPGTKEKVTAVVDDMAEKLGLDQSDSTVKNVLDGLVYAYCSFTVNFTKSISLIRQINPTAKIIVEGTYNAFDDITLSVDVNGEPITVDFASVWDQYIKLADNYITTLCPLSLQYKYAPLGEVEMFATALAECDSADDVDPAFAKYLIEDDIIKNLNSTYKDYVLYAFVKGAKNTNVDITSLMSGGLSWDKCRNFIVECAKTMSNDKIDEMYANADSGLLGLMTVYIRLMAGYRSPGAHPNAAGYQTKLSAVTTAWKSFLPTIVSVPVTIGTAAKDATSVTYKLSKSVLSAAGSSMSSIGSSSSIGSTFKSTLSKLFSK